MNFMELHPELIRDPKGLLARAIGEVTRKRLDGGDSIIWGSASANHLGNRISVKEKKARRNEC